MQRGLSCEFVSFVDRQDIAGAIYQHTWRPSNATSTKRLNEYSKNQERKTQIEESILLQKKILVDIGRHWGTLGDICPPFTPKREDMGPIGQWVQTTATSGSRTQLQGPGSRRTRHDPSV